MSFTKTLYSLLSTGSTEEDHVRIQKVFFRDNIFFVFVFSLMRGGKI